MPSSYLRKFIINRQLILLYYTILCDKIDYVMNSNELYRNRKHKKDLTKDFLIGVDNTRQFDKMLDLAVERVLENKEKLSCLTYR